MSQFENNLSVDLGDTKPTNEPGATEPRRLDLDAARQKLSGKTGASYWRGLEELSGSEEFNAWLEDEFPNRRDLAKIDRRSLLKFMGASMALAGLGGCRSVFLEEEKIVPYVKQPEEIVLGKPMYYASAIPMNGYGVGILVESREGRPIKIEGNPEHPESLGATSAHMQAAILDFYDPDRSQSVMFEGEISTWDVFYAELRNTLAAQRAKGGSGLRILTETIASPTLADQITRLLASYPGARWYQYDACGRDAALSASREAFGSPLLPIYDFKRAKAVVALDSDFFQELPGSLRYARDFMDGRRVMGENKTMNRLYSIESMPTLVGATADHRWACRASDIKGVALALAAAVGVPGISVAGNTAVPQETIAAIARDLQANRGAAMVVPGENQPADVHLICHAINAAIGAHGATVTFAPPIVPANATQIQGIKELVDDLNANRVDALLILGGNPVYNAPSDLNFGQALQKASIRIHHGHYFDETSRLCNWHIPLTHFLEEWSDVRAFDGTVSIVQPLIAPLFESKSAHQVIGAVMGEGEDGYKILQASYQRRGVMGGANFKKAWNKALNDGLVPNTRYATTNVAFNGASLGQVAPSRAIEGIEISFRPDPNVGDGRMSNNGWMQELPKPLTKITWENAVIMSPRTAQKLGLNSEDGVELGAGGAAITGPVWVQPGHPDDSVTVHLGYGRTASGVVGTGIGFNAFLLRTSNAMSFMGGAQIRKIGNQSHPVASTQIHHSMEGRDIARLGTLEELQKNPTLQEGEGHGSINATRPEQGIPEQSVFPDEIFNYDGPQWGMTVDMNTCIGCNACVTACQAENNIPVVGKDAVKRGRELHWIRIDRYYTNATKWDQFKQDWDPVEDPFFVFQPMMCVHCEKAPCEPVCPVGATMHSHEGLNQMIYNRCVGTRYCSNNCPYKVRRFNYLNFSDNQAQFTAKDEANRTRVPLLRLLNNPDVTVRGRGVMEKCTYCVQRINDARIEAKKQGRDPKDGEIKTACQQACPTKTIVFGNVADPESEVSKIRRDLRSYGVLAELQTRPRTTYLGKIRNPNPEIKA